MTKGLDKAKVVFVEAQIEFTCAVCNTTTYEFPCTGAIVFECMTCKRHFKLDVNVRPMTRDEVKYHLRKKYEFHKSKDASISFD